MKHRYVVDIIAGEGLSALEAGLEEYELLMTTKIDEVCRELAEMGVETANLFFSEALYDGINSYDIHAEQRGENKWAVVADGATVLFVEFGAGIHYPNSHPESLGFVHGGYGIHGLEDYWFYTGQPGNAGGELAYGKTNTTITHGNPANAPMYNTKKELEFALPRVVKDVFGV